ncbi:hypothetical protein EMIHUDRAFT_448496, partial [Emiliania huxleyi CCMP1516]|uniref:Uncharacterized protein n=2 Tax=Emiliania huxleyi TaxID=2903 RepID=A0A0D3I7A0_EMIH1
RVWSRRWLSSSPFLLQSAALTLGAQPRVVACPRQRHRRHAPPGPFRRRVGRAAEAPRAAPRRRRHAAAAPPPAAAPAAPAPAAPPAPPPAAAAAPPPAALVVRVARALVRLELGCCGLGVPRCPPRRRRLAARGEVGGGAARRERRVLRWR